MKEENNQLKNNWVKLKKYIKKTKLEEFEKSYGKRYGKTFKQAEIIVCNMILNKMKEIEQGYVKMIEDENKYEKVGTLTSELLYEENTKLYEENRKLKKVIDKAIGYIQENTCWELRTNKVLDILNEVSE